MAPKLALSAHLMGYRVPPEWLPILQSHRDQAPVPARGRLPSLPFYLRTLIRKRDGMSLERGAYELGLPVADHFRNKLMEIFTDLPPVRVALNADNQSRVDRLGGHKIVKPSTKIPTRVPLEKRRMVDGRYKEVIYVPPATHHTLRGIAAEKGVSVDRLIVAILNKMVDRASKP